MEELNICILKKQIYCEFDKFYTISYLINCELFIQYVNNLINFYNLASSNIYLKSIDLLQEMKSNYDINNNIFILKPIIGTIYNSNVLLDLLSFFVSRTESRKIIYC